MTAPTTQPRRPFLQNSIIWEKKGPLPVWAWLALVLLLAIGFAWWRRSRSAGAAATASTGYRDELPGDQTAPPIYLLPVNSPSQDQRKPTPNDMPRRRPGTPVEAPPAGGADTPTTPPATPVVTIPEYMTAPPMTNLYSWSKEVEGQYGLPYPIIERAKATGQVLWGGPMGSHPEYGNIPYFRQATQVKIR